MCWLFHFDAILRSTLSGSSLKTHTHTGQQRATIKFSRFGFPPTFFSFWPEQKRHKNACRMCGASDKKRKCRLPQPQRRLKCGNVNLLCGQQLKAKGESGGMSRERSREDIASVTATTHIDFQFGSQGRRAACWLFARYKAEVNRKKWHWLGPEYSLHSQREEY